MLFALISLPLRSTHNSSFRGSGAYAIARSSKAAIIKAGFPPSKDQLRSKYIHKELFRRRNRIMHWGKVDYQQANASAALKAAQTAFAVLKAIDKEKYEAMEKAFREKATRI